MKHPNNGIPCNYVKKNKVALHSPTMENLQDVMLSEEKVSEQDLKYIIHVLNKLYISMCV